MEQSGEKEWREIEAEKCPGEREAKRGMEKYIIHGKVITMAEQASGIKGFYEDGYVHIVDGKIAGVGDMRDWKELVQVSDRAEVMDVGGRTVMPGLIEAHCHMGITEEKKGMEGDDCNENVDPVTPYLRAIDAINPMDAAFDDALAFLHRWQGKFGPKDGNLVSYADRAYDLLLSVVSASSDSAREACLHDAEELLLSARSVVPLYYYGTTSALSGELTGVYRKAGGVYFFDGVHPVEADAEEDG